MPAAPLPANENDRLRALRSYRILDTAPEHEYDDIVTIAAAICGTPIALVSLVDEHRQWFKARLGLDVTETPRELAFCAHTILDTKPLIVDDATLDERFSDNPFVVDEPRIRFYAGAPLIAPGGVSIGTLCAIDREPHHLPESQVKALQALARQIVALLELRRVSSELADALGHLELLHGLLPICAYCKRVRDDRNYWNKVETYLHQVTGAELTHCICPECLARHFPEA